jgi:hypothetical protein
VSRPLLQSTVSVWKSLEELGEMMRTLPLYSNHFLTIMCNVLMQYKVIEFSPLSRPGTVRSYKNKKMPFKNRTDLVQDPLKVDPISQHKYYIVYLHVQLQLNLKCV